MRGQGTLKSTMTMKMMMDKMQKIQMMKKEIVTMKNTATKTAKTIEVKELVNFRAERRASLINTLLWE